MKADLHIHSTFSDGFASPEEIVKEAIKKGIKCICITDHGEVEGAIRAMKFAFDKDILVIPGIEVTSKSGHILGINVKKVIPNWLSAEKTIKEIRKQGGLAIIAHPFDWPIEDFIGGEKEILRLQPDGIEAFNASVLVKSSNKKALDFALKYNFSVTAGSDAHNKEFIGRGYLEIPDEITSVQDVIDAILSKKVVPKGEVLSFAEILKIIKAKPFGFFKSIFSHYKVKGRKKF